MTDTSTALPVPAEIRDLADEVTGYGRDSYGPALRQIIDGYMQLAAGTWTADQTGELLSLLGGGMDGNVDVRALDALLIRHLGNPDTNPGLRSLPQARQDAIRTDTEQYAAYDADFAPRDLLNEAAGTADMHCPHPTD